jgi:4a-hydroxytetrahydrobiopterin dehydratase
MDMKTFSKTEVNDLLQQKISNWIFDGVYISRTFRFKNFIAAFSFMTMVALQSEKMDHHPDWSNVYNSVTVKLNTHDSNGITQMDFDLAEAIDRLFQSFNC